MLANPRLPADVLPDGARARLGTDRATVTGGDLEVSHDGLLIACTCFDGIELWNSQTGQRAGVLVCRNEDRTINDWRTDLTVRCIAFSPCGRSAAITRYEMVHVFDLATHQLRWQHSLPKAGICSLAFSQDGRHLAIGPEEAALQVRDVFTGKLVATQTNWTSQQQPNLSLAFSPDGALVAASQRHQVHLFDSATGELVRTLQTTAFSSHLWQSVLRFSKDGERIILAIDDAGILTWEVKSGKKLSYRKVLREMSVDRNGLGWLGEDFLIALIEERKPVIFDVHTGKKVLHALPAIDGVAGFPDGRTLAATTETGFDIFRVDSGAKRFDLPRYQRALGFTGGGAELLVESVSGELQRWNWQQGATAALPKLKPGLLSPDGSLMLVEEKSGAALFHTQTGKRAQRLSELPQFEDITFSPDGSFLICPGGYEGDTTFVDVRTGEVTRTFEYAKNHVDRMRASKDGKTLVATIETPKCVRVWESTQKKPRTLKCLPKTISFDVHPDGTLLAAYADDSEFVLCDLKKDEVLARFTMPEYVHDYQFSPDGAWLLVTLLESVALFDVARRTLVSRLLNTAGPVAFSPDSQWFVTSGGSHVTVWELAQLKDGQTVR